jgi:hypothetical protein
MWVLVEHLINEFKLWMIISIPLGVLVFIYLKLKK